MSDKSADKSHDRYVDGRKIMLGDRVAIMAKDKGDNQYLGTIAAEILPNTREARSWRVPNGGFLVKIDKLGLKVFSKADEGMRLISRGANSDQTVTEVREFLQGIQYVDDAAFYEGPLPFYKYDKYLSGERIHVGDIVETYGNGGKMQRGRIIKHFLPETKDPEAKDWGMQNGGMLIEFDDGGLVGYGPADEELFFVSRGSDARMTRNVHQIIKRVSNSCLLFSLIALIIISFIDVVPWKQDSLIRVFYSCGVVFVFSLIISVACVVKCKRPKEAKK